MNTLLIVDGIKAIKEYEKSFKRIMKQYKETYKGWGYMFKEVKPKGAKKPYFYWYRWEYNADNQNNVWTYIGKEKPDTEIPDPPTSLLSEVNYNIVCNNVMINENELENVLDIFEGYQKFKIQPV